MPQTLSILPQTPASVTWRLTQSSRPRPRKAPTFALYTLGCKVNQADSHQIARLLLAEGFKRVEFREVADLYVIDTCTVTHEADRKSRKAAARARRNNPQALVAVTGCAATYAADQFRRVVPDALVLSNARKWELPELALERLQARADWADYTLLRRDGLEPIPDATRERAVVKVQDGCNHKCAFCIIPSVRGQSVLKPRAQILREARAMMQEGARELVVTGVSMGDFSPSRGNQELCDLLRDLANLDNLARLRVSSIDVADADEEFLQLVAHHPKICPHLHFALQSGAASTLKRMRRRYSPETFLKVAHRWRQLRPDGGLTTDIIVGFPGETDAEFEASMSVARAAKFSAIHVFPYSPRQGTHAADLPAHVAPDVKARRVEVLLCLAHELARDYAAQFIGQSVPVMLEGEPRDGILEGLTPHYLKARVQVEAKRRRGETVSAHLEAWRGDAFEARALTEP